MMITPIKNKKFGAVVTNVKLKNISEAEFSEIKEAFLEFGFLLFPRQLLTEEENIHFGERFGTIEFGARPIANQKKYEDGTYGEILGQNMQRMRTNVGNEFWHTDSSYRPISSKCAILSAVKVTEKGGETELADMRSGYADLKESIKHRISDLSAYHSNQYSQANDLGDFPPAVINSFNYHGEAYLRPLVKIHPETGIKNLFIGRHAFGIQGLGRKESRELLNFLLAFVVSDKTRVFKHKWEVGDTLIWDNRALLHRAKAYDYSNPRVLTGTRVAGEAESELAYYPSDPKAQSGRDALESELALLREEAGGKKFGGSTAPTSSMSLDNLSDGTVIH